MSVKIRKVPLHFPYGKGDRWPGNTNPYEGSHRMCRVCGGSGDSPEARALIKAWYGRAPFSPAFNGRRLYRESDEVIRELAAVVVDNSYPQNAHGGPLTAAKRFTAQHIAQEANARWSCHLSLSDVEALGRSERKLLAPFKEGTTRDEICDALLCARVQGHFGSLFDTQTVFSHVCAVARCQENGLPYACHACDGEGEVWESPELKRLYEEWTPEEPPEGPGLQMWEVSSNGELPISPVFENESALMEWLLRGGNEDEAF